MRASVYVTQKSHVHNGNKAEQFSQIYVQHIEVLANWIRHLFTYLFFFIFFYYWNEIPSVDGSVKFIKIFLTLLLANNKCSFTKLQDDLSFSLHFFKNDTFFRFKCYITVFVQKVKHQLQRISLCSTIRNCIRSLLGASVKSVRTSVCIVNFSLRLMPAKDKKKTISAYIQFPY